MKTETRVKCWESAATGSSDHVSHYYASPEFQVVLIQNYRLEYVGAEFRNYKTGELIAEYFSQNPAEDIRPDFMELSDNYKATIIFEWLMCAL